MNMTDQHHAILEKANQMSGAVWSLVFAAIAAYLVGGLGSDADWWIYALLFTPSVFRFARALADEPAVRKAPEDCFGELPISVGDGAVSRF